MVWSVGVATTAVVAVAFAQLGFEVARLDKPWAPFIVRCVVIGAFWVAMLRAYLISARVAMVRRRWWIYLLSLLLILTAMAVTVIYRMLQAPAQW